MQRQRASDRTRGVRERAGMSPAARDGRSGCDHSQMELDELLPAIPTPDWEKLSDDSAVGEAAFELLKAAAGYAHLAAGLLPTDGYARNEAILAGLVVKVSKLGAATIARASARTVRVRTRLHSVHSDSTPCSLKPGTSGGFVAGCCAGKNRGPARDGQEVPGSNPGAPMQRKPCTPGLSLCPRSAASARRWP